jgi:ABC-type uncharacterized transport system ATPase subunit
MPEIIRVESLVKKFGEFVAVAGIDFSVQAGEIFGFLGPAASAAQRGFDEKSSERGGPPS